MILDTPCITLLKKSKTKTNKLIPGEAEFTKLTHKKTKVASSLQFCQSWTHP
jgi:hypothetical protein